MRSKFSLYRLFPLNFHKKRGNSLGNSEGNELEIVVKY